MLRSIWTSNAERRDLALPGMLPCRSGGGAQMPVIERNSGETLHAPDNQQGPVSTDEVATLAPCARQRFAAGALLTGRCGVGVPR